MRDAIHVQQTMQCRLAVHSKAHGVLIHPDHCCWQHVQMLGQAHCLHAVVLIVLHVQGVIASALTQHDYASASDRVEPHNSRWWQHAASVRPKQVLRHNVWQTYTEHMTRKQSTIRETGPVNHLGVVVTVMAPCRCIQLITLLASCSHQTSSSGLATHMASSWQVVNTLQRLALDAWCRTRYA